MSVIEVEDLWKKFKLRSDRADSFVKVFTGMRDVFLHRSRRKPVEKEFWALKGISFSVEKGESLGVIGVNGSGKSTLLKLLTGVMRPTRGSIHVNGKKSSLIELGAGFHPDFSGRDNVYLSGMILGLTRAQVQEKFDEIVAFAELEQFIDVPVKYYSSGMQARLGFSVATAVEPDILIVDEVLAVGDSRFQQKCLERIRGMQNKGVSIILVSHGLGDIEAVCQKALWLHKGELVMFGEAGEVIEGYRTRECPPGEIMADCQK